MADPNTRQGKRTPVTLKIKFKSETLEQFIERYAVDVSQGGIFIRTKEPLAVGTQMRFEFQLRDASPLIGGEGTVVWTRENDPSRPAIAPGMGVRFDRLAEGSQSVLERILAEKAKQAPQRSLSETAKPPMFTDVPTRVAPPPVQDALLGGDSKAHRKKPGDDLEHTPLPKPMPFHSDADEFPEEAFEEATKVRALDDLVAQTADPSAQGDAAPQDELASRRVEPAGDGAATPDPSSTSPGFASGRTSEKDVPLVDRDSAPGLPSPPETHKPRLLDTSPSPRTDGTDPMEKLAKTKLGLEPAHVLAARAQAQSASPPLKDTPSKYTGPQAVAATELAPGASGRVSRPDLPVKRSAAPLVILILVLLAAGAAGVWFFFLRDKAAETNNVANPVGSAGSGSAVATGSDAVGSGSAGSGSAAVGVGSGSAAETPKGPTVETEIVATAEKSDVKPTIEIVGTDQRGSSPLKAQLEKGKAYKARITAPGFATVERDIQGGQDKETVKLAPKPRTIAVKSQPPGALILIDGAPVGHSTPYDVALSKAQSAKKTVKVRLTKQGFKPIEKVIDAAAYVEDDDKMVASVEAKLEVQRVRPNPNPNPNPGSGSASQGSAGSAAGSATKPPEGSGAGSATKPPEGSGAGSAPPPPPPAGGSASSTGSGASAEPEPDFLKQ